MEKHPQCHIVAGSNGAGKTTFALDYLMNETDCRYFINADLIAQGISPLNPVAAQMQAGRIFLEQLNNHIRKREHFCFETTLSGLAYLNKIRQWKKDGWIIILHYLWIPDPSFSAMRVKERVAQGGHDIPRNAIMRRWHKSLRNLFNYMPECDELSCYDNSDINRDLIFSYKKNTIIVENESLYQQLEKNHHHE